MSIFGFEGRIRLKFDKCFLNKKYFGQHKHIASAANATLISKDTSGFTSNALLIRFPIMLSVYMLYRMHKVERRMVKTNVMNTQGDKLKSIVVKQI